MSQVEPSKPEPLDGQSVTRLVKIPIGVILARKEIQSPWSDFAWQPVGVVMEPPAQIHGKICQQGENWTHFFMECAPLELYRKDAPAYRDGLMQEGHGSLWVVLGENEGEGELPYKVHLVTASPYEAQDYLDSGELVVETVDMPQQLRAIIEDYVDHCPPEEEFIKRKQNKKFHDQHSFGQQSFHEIRELEKKRR